MFPIYSPFGQDGTLNQTRYPKAGEANPSVRIGIIEARPGARPVWADFEDTPEQYFGTPFWGADSREIYISREPRRQNTLDLYAVSVTDGSRRHVYHEEYPTWVEWISGMIFTEKGLYMLATILKSPKAVQTTIAIVEAYAKLKELSRVIVEIPQQEDNTIVQKQLLHRGGQLIEDLITDMLPKKSTETSFELNLAMFKLRHSVRRENDEELKQLKEEVQRLRNLLEGAGKA